MDVSISPHLVLLLTSLRSKLLLFSLSLNITLAAGFFFFFGGIGRGEGGGKEEIDGREERGWRVKV